MTARWPYPVVSDGGQTSLQADYPWMMKPPVADPPWGRPPRMQPPNLGGRSPIDADPLDADPLEADASETDPLEADPKEADPLEADPPECRPSWRQTPPWRQPPVDIRNDRRLWNITLPHTSFAGGKKHSGRMCTARLETVCTSVSVATTRCHSQGTPNDQVWTGLQWSPPDVNSRGVSGLMFGEGGYPTWSFPGDPAM